MRILFVTQVPLDRPDGGSRHVLGLSKALARLGHELTLLGPGEAAPEGVRRLKTPRGLQPGARLELVLSAMAVREALLHRPRIAYVRIAPSTSVVIAALSAIGVPVVLELNGPVLEELARRGRSRRAIEAVRFSLGASVAAAKLVVAASENVARHAREELGAKRVVVLDNGVDLEVATPGDREEAKRALGLPVEQRFLSMVGGLGPELRLDLLAGAHRTIAGVGLLVVGDGPQAGTIEAMAMTTRPSSPVLFLGQRPHAEAIQAIRAADVCLNLRDGDLGMKGLEYAAVGRRQVAFKMEGSERLLSLYPDQRAVFLVEERSAPALKAAIQTALMAELEDGPLPSAAVEAARARLGWEQKARRLMEILADAS